MIILSTLGNRVPTSTATYYVARLSNSTLFVKKKSNSYKTIRESYQA